MTHFKPKEPKGYLKQALENLEVFAQHIENDPPPSLSYFEVIDGKLVPTSDSSLKKTIESLFRRFISSQSDSESPVITELLHSSEVIKNYFPLILKMEEGSTEQKKFAALAKDAIERFNQAVDHLKNTPMSWSKKLAYFLCGQNKLVVGNRLVKIDLPPKTFMQFEFSKRIYPTLSAKKKFSTTLNAALPSLAASQKITSLRGAFLPTIHLERQTLELYQMKVISLLEKHKLFSAAEARELVLKTQVDISLDKETQILEISQRLVPLPGYKIEIAAIFQKDSREMSYNIFLKDCLSVEVNQTGFPHPSQHHGWALSEALIPKCLGSVNSGQLPIFQSLYQDKQKNAEELLPQGVLAGKAKKFLKSKSYVFNSNKNEFLQAHKALVLAIFKASSWCETTPETDFMSAIDSYFTYLINHASPYDLLSSTYEKIMAGIATLPYAALEKAWLNEQIKSLAAADDLLKDSMKAAQNRWEEQLSILNGLWEHEAERHTLAFCLAMAKLFSIPIQQILLQQHALLTKEISPKLDLFSQKIQTALYLQLWEFQHELALDLDEIDMFRRISRLLEDDISLFESRGIPASICDAHQIVLEMARFKP